jgi:3-oxoacyl-(acyl-carrier-protein) synthase
MEASNLQAQAQRRSPDDLYEKLGRAVASFLKPSSESAAPEHAPEGQGSVVVTGASVGLPGLSRRVFAEDNIEAILSGRTLIDPVSLGQQARIVDKRVVRLVKESDGSGRFEPVDAPAAVIKLAGQGGELDLCADYGITDPAARAADVTGQLALAAALEALRDAGIPLVRRFEQGQAGRWALPESMADETGVIFASAFPGYAALIDICGRYQADRSRRDRLAELEALRAAVADESEPALDERIRELRTEVDREAFYFPPDFLSRIRAAGHDLIAGCLGARGPSVQVNAACASGAQAMGLAADWIRCGRCRRVLVVSADDVTSEGMLEWFGAGFLAAGTATTESDVTRAALPFDRRRHGLIVGMGASGLVLEAEDAVRERGMRGIAEVLAVEVSNSAFHRSRLDERHVAEVMERLLARVEKERGLSRAVLAQSAVFVSHETYSPARGGSAAAEIHSLRRAFGADAAKVVIANTKGLTGHPMGAGIEEAVAVKILQTGLVPPVPNLKEPDPELGELTISQGGRYPVRYALRFAAGFGSQIVISLLQKVRSPRKADEATYRRWLEDQAGREGARVELDRKVLRIRDEGAPKRSPARSRWSMGDGPALRCEPALDGEGNDPLVMRGTPPPRRAIGGWPR